MSAERRRFAVVHNIPAPYRVHMFRVLAERLADRGYDLHVYFMAAAHRERPHWTGTSDAMGFSHSFHRDVGAFLRGREWHLNPGMLARLRVRAPEVLLVGGPWDSLTSLAVTFGAPATKRIAWIEGNPDAPGIAAPWARWAKRECLARYDVIATPGRAGTAFARMLLDGAVVPIADLPNLVDESRFRADPDPRALLSLRSEIGVGPDERLAVWNARLLPAKGVPEFLELLEPRLLDGWKLVVFGEGALRERVLDVVARRDLGNRVRLNSYWPYARMPDLYAAADLLVLASIEDPNPLSVVEALHSGLPLLVSKRIGNLAEALVEGENGWSFDPLDAQSVRAATALAFGTPPDALRRMGAASRRHASSRWSSVSAIDAFLDGAGVVEFRR